MGDALLTERVHGWTGRVAAAVTDPSLDPLARVQQASYRARCCMGRLPEVK